MEHLELIDLVTQQLAISVNMQLTLGVSIALVLLGAIAAVWSIGDQELFQGWWLFGMSLLIAFGVVFVFPSVKSEEVAIGTYIVPESSIIYGTSPHITKSTDDGTRWRKANLKVFYDTHGSYGATSHVETLKVLVPDVEDIDEYALVAVIPDADGGDHGCHKLLVPADGIEQGLEHFKEMACGPNIDPPTNHWEQTRLSRILPSLFPIH